MATHTETRLSQIAEVARRMKADRVRLHGNDPDPEESDLGHVILCDRQNELMAQVMPKEGGPLMVRACCFWTAALLPCDVLFLVTDGRMKTVEAEEDVALGQLHEDWMAGKREGISEVLCVQRYPFIGPATFVFYAYEREGTQLTWKHVFSQGQNEGATDDHFKAGFAKRREFWPKLRQTLDQEAGSQELTLEEQRFHEGRGIARYLSTRQGVGAVKILTDPPAFFVEGQEEEEPSD